MKRQIRKGVFETNSSSTHSLVMCLKSDFDRWNNGEVLLFTGSGWCYPDDNAPQKNHFYTKEQAIEFEKSSNILRQMIWIGIAKKQKNIYETMNGIHAKTIMMNI